DYDKPSDQPERVADRVTRHRTGVTTAKAGDETPVKREETPFLFNTELERELEPERELKPPTPIASDPLAASAAVVEPPVPSKIQAVPKPNKLGDLVDAVKAAGVGVNPSPADAAAVKRCPASAAKLASAYVAAYRGEWPPDSTWLRDNLSLAAVCKRIDGYEAFLAGGAKQSRASTNGRVPASGNGYESYDAGGGVLKVRQVRV
ncbi:MAG TPA: hypothetical protein VIU62_06870, partial [Chloroflexota bacterium]